MVRCDVRISIPLLKHLVFSSHFYVNDDNQQISNYPCGKFIKRSAFWNKNDKKLSESECGWVECIFKQNAHQFQQEMRNWKEYRCGFSKCDQNIGFSIDAHFNVSIPDRKRIVKSKKQFGSMGNEFE